MERDRDISLPEEPSLRQNPKLIGRLIRRVFLGESKPLESDESKERTEEAATLGLVPLKRRPTGAYPEFSDAGPLALPGTQRILAERDRKHRDRKNHR